MEWISTKDRLPETETPVLAIVSTLEAPVVLELRWEICNTMIESYFKDFVYWDDPNNDGQDYADNVTHWMPLPKIPESK